MTSIIPGDVPKDKCTSYARQDKERQQLLWPAGIQLVMPEIGSHGCQDNKNGSNEGQEVVECFYGELSEILGADVAVGKQFEVVVGAGMFELEDLVLATLNCLLNLLTLLINFQLNLLLNILKLLPDGSDFLLMSSEEFKHAVLKVIPPHLFINQQLVFLIDAFQFHLQLSDGYGQPSIVFIQLLDLLLGEVKASVVPRRFGLLPL